MPKDGLEVTDALAAANLKRSDFLNAVNRGLYPSPPTENGVPRVFDLSELIAAYVLGSLYEREVVASFACPIAVDVLHAVRRNPHHKTLSAWKVWLADEPVVLVSERPPRRKHVELFRFEIAEIRQRMLAGIRQKTIDETQAGNA